MRKLSKNSKDAKLGGVCSGLGEYFGIDPIWFRLAFILGFVTPFIPAFFIYIILLLLLN